jgi:Raf kinase inhibitor-like YbhB/YbcL family protein
VLKDINLNVKQGERIPKKYTADGDDLSPPLAWTEPPEGTVELALICDDPDAPAGTWNHWIVYGLSPEVKGLKEGIPTTATVPEPALKQGVTSFRKTAEATALSVNSKLTSPDIDMAAVDKASSRLTSMGTTAIVAGGVVAAGLGVATHSATFDGFMHNDGSTGFFDGF